MERQKYLLLYLDFIEQLEAIPQEACAELVLSLMRYARDRVEPAIKNDIARVLFLGYKTHVDKDFERMVEISNKRAEAGRKGAMVTNSRQMSANVGKCQQMSANVGKTRQSSANPAINNNNNKNNNNNEDIKETTSVAKKDGLSLTHKQDVLEKNKEEFKESIKPYLEKYDRDLLNDFFEYWTEPNKSGTRMRFQLEKTWDIGRRLARWAKNQK